MKIELLNRIKYKGGWHSAGKVLNVDNILGSELVAKNAAILREVEKPIEKSNKESARLAKAATSEK